VWSPCYFTGWTAAHHWALTEQVFRTTVLKTSERVRAATVKLLDHDHLVGHLEPESLSWGLKSDWRDGVRLRFADPARTVVDILNRPDCESIELALSRRRRIPGLASPSKPL
jgi:hypothetical protein